MSKQVVVLTGAGISAESGLKTFRDSDGLWEGHRVEDVATPEAWSRDPQLVLNFYNERRNALRAALPNAAHLALVELESKFRVQIVTQNVDDLHERAGSSNVLHLHGELIKARSSIDEACIYPIIEGEIRMGDLCEIGSQLRPHIVWFGEAVPLLEAAMELVSNAELLIIIGTSLVVYPAASLIYYAQPGIPIFIIDPKQPAIDQRENVTFITKPASVGVPQLVHKLLK